MDAMRATAELPILASSTSLIDNAKIRHFSWSLSPYGFLVRQRHDKVEKTVFRLVRSEETIDFLGKSEETMALLGNR